MKLMSHAMKTWERLLKLDEGENLAVVLWLHAVKKHYRCNVCFENVDIEYREV